MLKKFTAAGIMTVAAAGAMMAATPAAFADNDGQYNQGSVLGGALGHVDVRVPVVVACDGIGGVLGNAGGECAHSGR